MDKIFKKSFLVATVTFALDFTFHFLFTNPMESLTYFVIKFLLSFLVAVGLFSFNKFNQHPEKRLLFIVLASLIFSTLMSTYYRAWELGEAGAPFGSRAPDIAGIERYSLIFTSIWWLAHASFFALGAWLAIRVKKLQN